MDSLKLPKTASSNNQNNATSGNKSAASGSGSTPITVRFNAGEETLDDIFQSFHKTNNGPGGNASGGGDSVSPIVTNKNSNSIGGGDGGHSLSSSPSQQQQSQFNNDDLTLRNNFLQGAFFNRKRSDSIEGISPTSSASLLATSTAGDSGGSGGTWKLIKGKVSQTIEDIKSSKSQTIQCQPPQPIFVQSKVEQPLHEPDTDSVSEELQLEPAPPQQKIIDSDSDFENELLLENESVEGSRLRRGLASLKSKVKAKSAAHQFQHASTLTTALASTSSKIMRKDGPTPTGSTTSLRSTLLRKRRKNEIDQAELATPSVAPQSTTNDMEIPVVSGKSGSSSGRGIIAAKKDIEIESGVEMLEDMIPPATSQSANVNETETDIAEGSTSKQKRHNMELKLNSIEFQPAIATQPQIKISEDIFLDVKSESRMSMNFGFPNNSFSLIKLNTHTLHKAVEYAPTVSMFILFVLVVLPINDFIRGVFATILAIAFFEKFGAYVQSLIEKALVKHAPEKTKFKIPDYSSLPICEIPSVEEHKTVKSYAGWMNEVNSYDPNNFHISMTKSVYVKLEGTILRLSSTSARIPKRIVWNEPPIDRSKILFTNHRTYNLMDSRIELLPLGLARKRHFNRKYPIQLIIKNDANNKRSTAGKQSEAYNIDSNDNKDVQFSPSTAACSVSNVSGPSTSEERPERKNSNPNAGIDFAATVLNADLQTLRNPDEDEKYISVPYGDEVRLLLFSRGPREKEDWYRRFVAASNGDIHDQDLRLPNLKLVEDTDMQAAATKAALLLTNVSIKKSKDNTSVKAQDETTSNCSDIVDTKSERSTGTTPDNPFDEANEDDEDFELPDDTFEGLLMSSCAARNPAEYIRFMSIYQSACSQSFIPMYKKLDPKFGEHSRRRHRRIKRQQNELWKGIDQSLFLGPSGSVVWANVLIGRLLYSCLNHNVLLVKIQEFLQKKLDSIKLPSFMENVNITQINLGSTPPLIHRVSQPMMDERGTWIDADVTYEGLIHITVTTKLNLLRMKRPKRPTDNSVMLDETNSSSLNFMSSEEILLDTPPTNNAIFDSDAESSGGSSTESESPINNAPSEGTVPNEFFQNSPGNARRIVKIVDRIATSNLFQYATELSYVKRAMENISANITLRVDIKGLVGRSTINLPPPPSDRIWLAFRGPPRLWISAKPTVGDKSVDWSIVTNVIESKLCEEVNKYLVYPNMVDLTLPFLAEPTYKETSDKN